MCSLTKENVFSYYNWQVEADCYHCLTNMLDKAQDNYVHDSKGVHT
jgi:hypothetical protein